MMETNEEGIEEKIEETEEALSGMEILENIKKEEYMAGRPYYLDYEKSNVLITDKWKENVGGVPQGTFLLAFYEEEDQFIEALLLRVLKPTRLPAEDEVIGAIVDYYKDSRETSGSQSEIDVVTKVELSYSGLECRVLGTFYEENGKIIFGSDVENFYSSYHYKVYKLKGKSLEYVVNQDIQDFRLGKVRYSSSRRFQNSEDDVPVYINANDFLGNRTALFGMTRTGKSNTVKKIIESTEEISKKFETLENEQKVGQIIFDIDGEYANPNEQDEGTAIFEMYDDSLVERWSTIIKDGFKVMKTNFYEDIEGGFNLIKTHLSNPNESGYIKSFLAVDLSEPENYMLQMADKSHDERIATIDYDRKKAIYQCCLKKAGFLTPNGLNTVKFFGDQNYINDIVSSTILPHNGITFDQAETWFTKLYEAAATDDGKAALKNFEDDKGYKFINHDIESMLIFLTGKPKPQQRPQYNGHVKLRPLISLHSPDSMRSFEKEIVTDLRNGKIIIVDLSQGDPQIQKTYSERICIEVFADSMKRFIENKSNNFIQFYFEEAHNLFPKKEDKDLNQIYNRIAKEGAKLKLGLVYATQEASSISGNILKNTQNWFVSHLNNTDELNEIQKYYDFSDFVNNLRKFSPTEDTGFIRMKVHSNPFIVPVQIDEFRVDLQTWNDTSGE